MSQHWVQGLLLPRYEILIPRLYRICVSIKMKLLTRNFEILLKSTHRRRYCKTPTYIYPSEKDEYTSTPQYPAIPLHDRNSEKGKKKEWYDKIKRQLTVEEKLFEVNVQRRWGWKCLMIREGQIPFNNLDFAQHMTKSHIMETENLPDYYNQSSERSKLLTNEIKNDVIDALEYQLSIRRPKLSEISEPLDQEKEMTKLIISELNRILMNRIWNTESHLKSIQVDYSPRIEAFWKIESMVETFVKKEYKEGLPADEIPEEFLERPSDKYIQYFGHPILQLRATEPLPELIDKGEANIFAYSVPMYEYDPHFVLGYELDRRFLSNIPGFWPGDDREFSFISYHDTNHLKYRPPTYGPEDTKEALHSQAVFSSFGWLMPLACYQGFSSFHDITYPMMTQTILTNGREFTFAPYQLNTTEMHWENFRENVKSNICWVTPTKALYEVVENGKLKGFNEEVLQMLVQFYINKPKALENVELKPYLGEKVKHIADYEDDEKVEWLEEKYKRVCANRYFSPINLMYDVKDWERIYKIQFRMRPCDGRKRPFELRQNPYLEKLSDIKGEYIPKHLREDKDLPKWRQRKFRRTFYPE